MNTLYTFIHKINAMHIRIIALSLLVISIGSGSQFLVNAFAAGAQLQPESLDTVLVTTAVMPPVSLSRHHGPIIIHTAGKNGLGGYTITGK